MYDPAMTHSPGSLHYPLVVVALCLGLLACDGISKINLLRVATAGRDGWQAPERVIEALGIEPGDAVAEIGAGSGYWIPWLSRAVGPSGRVYAVDVDDGAIAELHALVAEEQLQNVEVVLAEYHDPLLPDGRIDLAITSKTYHHIEARPQYFALLRRDLSDSGRVAHIDVRDDLTGLLRWLETEGHWMDPEQMDAEMAQAGYRRIGVFDFLAQQNFRIYAPADSAAGR